MQGIKLQFDPKSLELIQKQFDLTLDELQDKANKNPIKLNVDDLAKRLKDVEDKVKHSMDNVTKLSKKAISNALTGVNYDDFKSKIDEVVMGLNKSGNQVSDVFTTIDAKTKAITGATVKYTDNLGKTITEVYKLKTAWKNVKDEEGKFVLDKNGNKTKQLYMELKPATVSYDNNISKQQQDNYSKLNKILEEIYSKKKKIEQLDGTASSGQYANILSTQVNELDKKYKEIYNSVIKISEEEETSAISNKQNIDLAEKRKKLERDIAELIIKQNDETLRKTSTTASGQRNLGEKVDLRTPFNFNASQDDLDKYAKEVAGLGAEWGRVVPKVDSAGNKMKEVNVRVKEGSDRFRNYKMVLDESTGSLYKVDQGLSDVNRSSLGFIGRIKQAIKDTVAWSISVGGLYGAIRQLKTGSQYVTDMNQEMVNLSKVVDLPKDKLDEMNESSLKLGKSLATSSKDVMAGFAETGRFIKDTKDIQDFTKTAIMAQNVTDMSVAEASKSISTAMISLKMNAKDSMQILDVMNELQNSYRVSATDISDAIGTMGSAASQANTKLQDLAGMITGIVTATGEQGSEVGTALI